MGYYVKMGACPPWLNGVDYQEYVVVLNVFYIREIIIVFIFYSRGCALVLAGTQARGVYGKKYSCGFRASR
jgi:hypothetical protein